MGNPLSRKVKKGTIGELLVQLRLLEYGVQAAPPLKDSGNDLIAVKGDAVKFVQVKTSASNMFRCGELPKVYHVLALVRLERDSRGISLDASEVFLLKKEEVSKKSYKVVGLSEYRLEDRVFDIWG